MAEVLTMQEEDEYLSKTTRFFPVSIPPCSFFHTKLLFLKACLHEQSFSNKKCFVLSVRNTCKSRNSTNRIVAADLKGDVFTLELGLVDVPTINMVMVLLNCLFKGILDPKLDAIHICSSLEAYGKSFFHW